MRPTTRHLVLVGAVIVGAATAATSAISLYGIAVKCGIPEPWAAANPIALDAGAAVSALAWITQSGERRVWGRRTAVAALTASLTENGIDHAVASGLLPVTLWLVLGVSACIPGMLFAVVHLAALMARDQDDQPATSEPHVPAGLPAAATVGDLVASQPHSHIATAHDHIARGGEEVAEAGVASQRRLTLAPNPPATVAGETSQLATAGDGGEDEVAKARRLLASGTGRPTLAKELGIEPHEARQLQAKPDQVATLLPRYLAKAAERA